MGYGLRWFAGGLGLTRSAVDRQKPGNALYEAAGEREEQVRRDADEGDAHGCHAHESEYGDPEHSLVMLRTVVLRGR